MSSTVFYWLSYLPCAECHNPPGCDSCQYTDRPIMPFAAESIFRPPRAVGEPAETPQDLLKQDWGLFFEFRTDGLMYLRNENVSTSEPKHLDT